MANEFISRKELIKNFWEFTNGGKQRYLIPEEIWEMVELAPTADVVEVVHASWEECDWVEYDGQGECIHQPKEAVCCSNCRNCFKKKLLWKDNYCPNCGAKMDGKKVE